MSPAEGVDTSANLPSDAPSTAGEHNLQQPRALIKFSLGRPTQRACSSEAVDAPKVAALFRTQTRNTGAEQSSGTGITPHNRYESHREILVGTVNNTRLVSSSLSESPSALACRSGNMASQCPAGNSLYTLTPITNNDSSPTGTLTSPRSTIKRTYDDMRNGALKPHVSDATASTAIESTLTPVQTPPDPPADPRPGPGKEKGIKAVYDPTFDHTLSKKEKQNYKAKYKVFGAENEPSAPPDPRLALAGYHQGLYHTKPSKVRVREAPYVVKAYAFDPKIAIGRGPAKRVVVHGFDPFSSETQIRALMGSYGSIEKLENKTDANGSFLGVCSIWYGDTTTRNESTKAHESARRAEKEGTGQKIGLKQVRIERDPEGTRARRYSERVIKARQGEQHKADKDFRTAIKRHEPPLTPTTPTVPVAPPPNAPKGPSGRGAGFRPDFRPPPIPEARAIRIPAQHVLVEKALILPTLKRNPFIFIAHCYVPVLGTTIEHLKKRMKSYNWMDVRCDSTGYFIIFQDNRRGEIECERCFRDCHMQPLFTYTMNMECQKYGNPNYQRSPSPARAAAERRVDAEKQRLRELDEADFENEKRERAQNLDLSKAALELLKPRLVSMIMNDIKQKIATPTLFDSLDPDRHREKRMKFGIPDPSARPSYADRAIPAPYMNTQEWRPPVGTSLTWHRNKPMSRFEKQKFRREIYPSNRPDSAFIDERRKKGAAARPRASQLHRRLQDFYESESDEETRTQLTRGSDEADSRAVSEIPQTPVRLDEGVQTPKAKRRKTDKGWAADSEDEGLDAHTKNLLGHLIGKEPEDMAMRELEQVISTLPRTSKLRKRALTEVKLRKQAEEDDALFFGIKKQQLATPTPLVDVQMEDVDVASTPEVLEEVVKPKKKKPTGKPAKTKKTKKQIQEEQEAARKEAEAREKLEVALEEDDAPTPNAQDVVEDEEPRAEVEWSVSADKPRKTVEDDPDLVLDIDGWQHVLKDEEDLNFLRNVLQKEKAARIGDVKLWAWEQKEIKALNNGGKHGVLNNAACISGYYLENPTGCARTEGVKKIAESEKSKYLPHRIRVQKQREEREAMAKKDPAAAAEAIKQAQAAKLVSTSNSRQNRVNNRRLVNDIAVQKQVLGDDAVSIGFNQLKKRKKLVKFDRSAIHNWGLYADENIGAGEMIIEYVGELVRQQVANLREIKYQQQGIGSSYLFRIDDDLVVDATKKGGIARFINHSCSPSCTAKIIRVDGTKRIVIYALRDIAKNEELTYDYKFEREIGSTDRIPCLCGAIGCKGFLN